MQCVAKSIDKVRSVVYVDSDPDLVSKCIVCFDQLLICNVFLLFHVNTASLFVDKFLYSVGRLKT